MAGGKQSPRDKMIGMMYLVLTALLALQVSNAVLEKFIFINGTLEQLGKDSNDKNSSTLTTIEAEVAKKGNRPEHKKVLASATELRKLTSDMRANFSALKDKMIEVTGGYESGHEGDKNMIAGAKDYDKVSTLMLQKPDGKEFEKQLDDYVAALNKLAKDNDLGLAELPQLTKNGDQMEAFKNNPDQNVKDFLTITFESTPTAAGMASVSQLEAEMLEMEKNVLNAMAQKVGAAIVDFNIIVPMVRPKSAIVASGANYEADLFITASASGLNPEMKVNGAEITVEDDPTGIKMGRVKIPARGEGKKQFTTTISVNDTTFTATYEYEVITPTLQISSATLKALYANCANPLNVLCPSLGNEYNPSFAASNAKTINGGKTGLVKIVPTSRRSVELTVNSNGVYVGKETFAVKSVPEPKVQVLDRTNNRADNKEFISAANATTLTVMVVADENFAAEAPEDKVYIVQSGRVFLPGAAPKAFSGARIPTGNVRPGTITIAVDKLVRRRYDGSLEEVKLDRPFIPVNVR